MAEARLFVLGGSAVGESLDLDGEAVLGREPGCTLVLADRSVSRRHARVYHDGLQWAVEDLGSRNGLHVDGERVESAILHDGDEFRLGDVPLRFRTSAGLASRATKVVPALEEAFEEEIVLEEVELEPELAPAASRSEPRAPEHREPRAPAPARDPSPGGLFRGDLSQQPVWVQALVFLLCAALLAALTWLAFRATTQVRSTL